MKSYIFLLIGAIFIAGCGRNGQGENPGTGQEPRTTVTVTHASFGRISQETTFSAVTVYLNKPVVSAQIPGFITETSVQPGARVKAGQLLFRLESKEQHALGGNGSVSVNAPYSGIVIDVQRQTGSYVTEGTTLCTIADTGSLVFTINIPYEFRKIVLNGSLCTLELPDGTCLPATIEKPLATMDINSQSELVIARADAPFLPEGMTVKAIFVNDISTERNDMLLPKSAVQSDETMDHHWIMKLEDDSTAVKVPVEVVRSNASEVEIKPGAISLQDDIILSGGYGLEDGARITIGQQ